MFLSDTILAKIFSFGSANVFSQDELYRKKMDEKCKTRTKIGIRNYVTSFTFCDCLPLNNSTRQSPALGFCRVGIVLWLWGLEKLITEK